MRARPRAPAPASPGADAHPACGRCRSHLDACPLEAYPKSLRSCSAIEPNESIRVAPSRARACRWQLARNARREHGRQRRGPGRIPVVRGRSPRRRFPWSWAFVWLRRIRVRRVWGVVPAHVIRSTLRPRTGNVGDSPQGRPTASVDLCPGTGSSPGPELDDLDLCQRRVPIACASGARSRQTAASVPPGVTSRCLCRAGAGLYTSLLSEVPVRLGPATIESRGHGQEPSRSSSRPRKFHRW